MDPTPRESALRFNEGLALLRKNPGCTAESAVGGQPVPVVLPGTPVEVEPAQFLSTGTLIVADAGLPTLAALAPNAVNPATARMAHDLCM